MLEITTEDILNAIMEIAYDGIVVVNKDGIIIKLSKAYAEFLGVEVKEVIGKYVVDVIENTRMHIVAKTGKAEKTDLQKIKGNYMVATRIPIIKNGVVVGAVGKVLFRNLTDFNLLAKKIKKMELELERYIGELNEQNQANYHFADIIGESEKIKTAKSLSMKAALTDSNVLILGESGTGKELFAHAIHNASLRSNNQFIRVNCAAIPADLIESELFGYEEGAFTGAKKGGKKGKFELADGGTIFLDEIGDLPLRMQAKLLRVLQEKEVEKIGGSKTKKVNVRIIAATNQNLEQMVKNGEFRLDLYFRLNVLTINIPPLRERKEDITILVEFFIKKIADHLNKKVMGISKEVIYFLKKYSWPGNIRELENSLERAINLIDENEQINLKHFTEKIIGQEQKSIDKSLNELIEDLEKSTINEVMRKYNGNKAKVANVLGISRSTLYEKIEKYQLLDKQRNEYY